jgi:hypothetical protein
MFVRCAGKPPIVSVGRIPCAMPSVERQRSDRDRKRREADLRDQKAVERAEHHPEDDGQDHRRPDGKAVLEQLGHEHAGETEHRRDREIDLPGDDDQRQRERHDRDLADVQADEEEVRLLEKVRRDAGAERDRASEQDDQQRLPAEEHAERRLPSRRRPAARRLVARFEVVDLSHGYSFVCAARARRVRRSTGRTRSRR